MAIKPFEQIFPGQNNPNRKPKPGKEVDPAEWERKQRLKEYRIAARREKRNRKSDEKKQRKLNATILRRMTRNPVKYTKNAGRNRLRAIEQERRKIHTNAVQMAQRLAAVYDPSGEMFNVKPVITLEDGRVVTVEAVERRKEKEAEKARQQEMNNTGPDPSEEPSAQQETQIPPNMVDHMNSERMKLLIESKMQPTKKPGSSKTQLKKAEMFEPRMPPPKPTIPDDIDLPSDEEENWMELWSLPDEELERRVLRAKKRAARARKELRIKQKSGKAERRAARDEKRRVYREIKQSWKVIREQERQRRKFLLRMEDEESKRLAVEVTNLHRKQALEVCAQLGFTLDNVEGVQDIQPRALGMKGKEVPFDKLEFFGDRPSGLKVKGEEKKREKPRGNRVDLGTIPDEADLRPVNAMWGNDQDQVGNMNANFIDLGSAEAGQDFEALNYNHKLRRKLRRAMESTEVRRELLVRETAIKYCEENGLEVDPVLRTPAKPQNIQGQRTMPNGQLETAKQVRVRSRVELAEFNRWAKVLRRQAKEMAIEAGIRIYLELMEVIPKREGFDDFVESVERAKQKAVGGNEEPELVGGVWPAQSHQSMADLLKSWEAPEDENAEGDGDGDVLMYNALLDEEAQSSEDSAAKQIQAEEKLAMERDAGTGGETESTSESD